MWILNDVIILAALAVLAFLYIRKKTAAMLAGVMICYCCLPAIRLGERGITPGYLVTAFLFVLFLIELFRKRIRLNRCQRLFLIAMAGSLLFTFLGWIINGSPAFSHLIHFAGLGQYMLGVLLLSIFFTSSDGIVTPEGVLYKAMPSILGLNGLFVILQFTFFDLSVRLMEIFYVYPGKNGPLNAMIGIDRFSRAFGTNYSPILLAIISLVFCSFLLGQSLRNGRLERKNLLLFFFSLSLGFLAFSKTVILGIVIAFFAAVVIGLFFAVRAKKVAALLKILGAYLANIVLVAGLVAAFGLTAGFKNQVRHYYGYLLNPLEALDSRYENILPENPQPEPSASSPSEKPNNQKNEPTGNMLDAMTVIRQHVLIGVGPAQVSGEFIGDSQIINALHDGGVLNALCYGLFYLWLFLSALKKQDYSRALMVVCLGLSCLSLPVFTYACTIPLVGYCITMDDKNLLFFRERKAPDTDSSVE